VKTIGFFLQNIALCSCLFAQSGESMEELLDTFVHNSDLSIKTRLQNAGNVIVFTREEIEMMQARNLKGILKSLPMLSYRENRLGIPDPFYILQDLPFNSNSIRIYIDNQEVTSASYGSGLFFIGDIDIGFVDHIEVYSLNPSFEYSTEPAKYLIKLYSKVAQRDKGIKATLNYGNRGFNQEAIQYASVAEKISSFAYLSRVDDHRKTYQSFDHTLSKDKKQYYFFGTLNNKEHHLQIQSLENERDLFIGLSTDARPNLAQNKVRYHHVGYENYTVENLKLRVVAESSASKFLLSNDKELFRVSSHDELLTVDTQYRWHKTEKNELTIGSKIRYKHFITDQLQRNGFDFPDLEFDRQTISTLYFEDHYALTPQWLLTLGKQISKVHNNSEVKDDTLHLDRVGVVYSDHQWVSKTFFHNSEFLIEPYLYTTSGFVIKHHIEPEKVSNITHEFQYKKDAYECHVVLGYSKIKNMPTKISNGEIKNITDTLFQYFYYVDFQYEMDLYNSLYFGFSYVKNSNFDDLNDFNQYKSTIRLLDKLGRFDISNEIIYFRDTLPKSYYFNRFETTFPNKNYFDYSTGVRYRYSDSLNFSLKGENLLDRAYNDYFERGRRNPLTKKWQYIDILQASPIEKRIYCGVEYFF